jgi:choline dehydrogenase-like flavoprotein
VIKTNYDFIVVGVGAAGSVLAAELSASGAQVLVIESGGLDDAPTIANPSIWFYNVNNRTFNMALGHVLGGGSSINASGVVFKYRGKMPDRPADSNAVEAEAPSVWPLTTSRMPR